MSDSKITRRQFGQQSIATGLLAASGCAALGRQGGDLAGRRDTRPNRPNVLLIVDDQHSPRAMGWTGQTQVLTPNLDRLAAQSVCFTDAYCASPVCAPARHSIYTGLYPAEHGVILNERRMRDGVPTLMAHLNQAGYTTANIGKMHNTPYHNRQDFQYVLNHEFFISPGCSHYYPFLAGQVNKRQLKPVPWKKRRRNWLEDPESIAFVNWVPEDLTPERWITDQSLEFIGDQLKHRPDQPFFLHASYFPPHHPYAPIAKYARMYDPQAMKLPPNFSRSDLDRWCTGRSRPSHLSDDEVRRWRALYFAFVTQFDAEVGRLLAGLQQLGVADNTIVMFMADHGDMLGEHGHFYKGIMYEASVGIPFMIRWPGLRGRSESAPVSHIDVMPTAMAAAALAVPGDLPGADLKPLLDGAGNGWADRPVYSEIYHRLPFSRIMLRRGPYKIMAIPHGHKPRIEYRLYDVSNDPWEINDLVKGSRPPGVFKDMKNQLMAEYDSRKHHLPDKMPPVVKSPPRHYTWPTDPWQPV